MSGIAQREGVLWVPDDTLDLLSVGLEGGYTDSEFQGMLAINKAGRDWLEGRIDIDTYTDILEYYGIPNPLELLDEFVEHTDLIMK